MAWRRKRNEDLERELRSHLQAEAEEHEGDLYAARRVFGNTARVAEDVREAWGAMWLERVGQDVAYALRTLWANPAFTATAVLSLALGIGANTAIFSLIDALMLRWLPVHNPQELVQLNLQLPGSSSPGVDFSYAIVGALADRKDIFDGVARFSGMRFDVGSPGSLNRVPGEMVTGAYYETLGLNPVVGRLLTREDDRPGLPPVAVISYRYWERQSGSSFGAVGQTVLINGTSVTIVGVSPPGFVGANVGSIADITLPVASLPFINPQAAPLLGPGNFWLRVLARPKAGVSPAETEARLRTLWPEMSESVIALHWPPSRKKEMADAVFHLTPGGTGWSILRQVYQKPLLMLMAGVALILLIACANVASLLLARGSARQREIAVRLAIGASRARVIRQLLTESSLLSLVGAVFGIALAWLSGSFLVNMVSSGPFQATFDLKPNWHILGFTSAVAILTAFLFGLAPALLTTAAGPSPVLKADLRLTRSRSRLLPLLLSAQIALSLLLLIGAGLLLRTLRNLQNFDPGFNREGVLVVDLEGHRAAVPQQLLDEIRRVPGIVAASFSTHTPLSGSSWSESAVPKGQPIPERDNALFVGAGPGFFETMQIPLLSGRQFSDRDSAQAPAVAVINEAFARRFFPNQNPIGQILSASVRGRRVDLEIVGLVKNTNAVGLRAAPRSTVYVSYAQLTGDFPTTVEMRATGSIGQVVSAIQKILTAKLPNVPIEVRPLSSQVAATMTQERMMATLASGFGMLALILACTGIYGLVAYGVARRTREMGIHIALGAERNRVILIVLKGAFRPVLIGIALGLPAAWAALRWLEAMLFGLKRTDPATIAGAVLLLFAAAVLAAFVPARRASHVDPLIALRHE